MTTKQSKETKKIPDAKSAIAAIKEKGKLGLPKRREEYSEWAKKMNEIDKKYGFI